jgi:O-antigen biosynthesis protein
VAEHGLAYDAATSRSLQDMGITCWHAPWIASIEEVLRRVGDAFDLVYLHRFGLMQRYAALVRRWCPRARLVYCVADLHYLRLMRRLAVESGEMPETQALSAEEAAGLCTAELLMALGADAVITHSSHELELLQRDVPEANAHLVPWEVVAQPTAVPFSERLGVAFVGSFGHGPNLDAALFLVEKVMPLVWEREPLIPCFLAGSDLPAVLRAAAGAPQPPRRVEVLGRVPKLMQVWDRVRVSAAPLRFGAGLKGKVLDSLAGGIPCVCTSIAAEGADLPGDYRDLVGDDAETLASTIVYLHNDAAGNAAFAETGFEWVREHLSAERIDAALAAAVRAEAVAPVADADRERSS